MSDKKNINSRSFYLDPSQLLRVYGCRFLLDIDLLNVYLSLAEIQHSMALISSHCCCDRLHHCFCLRSRFYTLVHGSGDFLSRATISCSFSVYYGKLVLQLHSWISFPLIKWVADPSILLPPFCGAAVCFLDLHIQKSSRDQRKNNWTNFIAV